MLALVAAGTASACGEVVYRNDFTTRTSAGAVPDADWHELAYPAGKGQDLALYRNYSVESNFVFSAAVLWGNYESYWDEWGKAFMDQMCRPVISCHEFSPELGESK